MSNYLSKTLKSGEVCKLRSIETLCTENCEGLGRLWREVTENQNVEIKIHELVSVLRNADQVVSLHIIIEGLPSQELVIDDGELVANTIVMHDD
ncbi:hypothetical protein [Pseudomonas sp. 273]|uniref:hypothetical protein n=1 Tax=Pseudomonas sp. 273 TaxID=75692 RepID=UPI0023D7E4DF|nr:hypothetical protein [Pseudomonas sp. 273]